MTTTPGPTPTATDGADLRPRIKAVIGPPMLIGLQDAYLSGPGGTQRIEDWVGWIAALLPLFATERAAAHSAGRAAGLHEAAAYARSRSVSNWGAASGSPSTVLCTVSDELYDRAGAVHQDGQP